MTVAAGASLVAKNSTINGTLTSPAPRPCSCSARPSTAPRRSRNSTKDVTIAGSTFNGGLALTGNTQVTANERYTRLAGAYGPILAGSTVRGGLTCADNSAAVKDFGATNRIFGSYSGCALAPVEGESPVGGNVPATLSLTLGAAGAVRRLHPGRRADYFASTSANVVSTAGDALLSVADPSAIDTGHLVNGTFVLPQPLQARARNAANTGPGVQQRRLVGLAAEPAVVQRPDLQRRGHVGVQPARSVPTTPCVPAPTARR